MTTNATFDAINVVGNATIAGTLSLTHTGSALSVIGNISVGGTSALNGTTTVGTSTTAATFALNGPTGAQRRVQWNTASKMRWSLYTNSSAETGSDVGSDLDLIAASDAGGSKGIVLRMERATGNVKFDPSKVYPNGVLTSNLQIAANDGIILGVGQRTISGAPGGPNAILNSITTINGASDPRTGGWPVNSLIQFDNATVNGPVGTGQYRPFIYISTQSGVGSVGAGGAMDVRSGDSASGGTGDRAAGQQFGTMAIRMTAVVNSNQGGTAANDTSGVAWGTNIVCQAQKNATYLNAIRGIEVNVGVDTGASALRMTGIKITQVGDNVTPFYGGEYIFMGRGGSSTTNLSAAIKFAGIDGGWSWGNASILLDGSNYGNTYSPTIGQPLGYFADAWACDIKMAFARSPGPFGPMLLDGTAIQIGVMRIVPSATGASIDTVGAYGTGTPTIAAAGTGYKVNDRLRYSNGGVAQVATITPDNVGGVRTVTVLRQPYLSTTLTPPSNPLTTTTDYNSVGTGCTLNVTWNTTAKTLTLQPSGATTAMGGPLILVADPTTNLQAATKQYVDAHVGTPATIYVPLSWNGITATGYGTGIGQIPVFSNRGSRPSYELNGQWIINQAAPTGTQGADVFIRHDGTSITTGTSANINGLLNLTHTVGASDRTNNWTLVSHCSTNSTMGVSVQALSAFLATDRLPGSNSHCWGALISIADQTGLTSSVVGGATLALEMDFASSGADDAVNPGKFGGIGNRHLVHFVVTRNQGIAQNEVTTGLWFGTTDSYIDSLIGMDRGSTGGGTNVRQVLDTRGAVPPSGVTDPVAAVRTSAGHIIDFNGGPALNSPSGNYLQYTTSGTPRLRYMVGTNEAWSIPDTANTTDFINLKNYGAKLDGIVNDSTAYVAARTAANARGTVGGVVIAPPGSRRGTLTPPTYTAPPVLWKLDGMTFGTGTTPVTNITSGDLVESFFSGGKYYQRTDAVGTSGAPVLRIDYTGPGTPNGVIQLTSTNTDADFYLWNVTSVINTTDTGAGQAVGFASEVTRKSGCNPLWLYFGHYTDQTGQGKGVLGTENLPGHVLCEIGATQNGPDNAGSFYAPQMGGRVGLHFACDNFTPPSWQAAHAYAVAATITPGNGYIYIVQTAGTSAALPPVWPTAPGTVTDGTVTWKFQTTVKSFISRMIDIAGPIGLGAALNIREVSIYDAGIEMSAATLDTVTNPNAAAIRIGANMPIDFSGDGTAAGQNRHTLRYTTSGTPRLRYMAGATEVWSFADNGTASGAAFGMGVGQIPVFSNRGNRPSFELNGVASGGWIINQAAPGPTVGADVTIRHDGSSVTTGSTGTINKLLQLTQTVGTTDPNTNWSFLVNTVTSNTVGGNVLPAYFQMWRQAGSNAHIWGQVTEVHCFTGSPSSVSGPAVTQEWDLVTSGADNAVNTAKFGGIGSRSVIHVVVGRDQGTTLNEVTHGIWIGTGSSYIDSVIGFELSGGSAPSMFIQALDTRGAVAPTGYSDPLASVRMSASQVIDFNGGPALNSPSGNYLQYTTTGTPRLRYMDGTVELFSIADTTGAVTLTGGGALTITAAGNNLTASIIATGSTTARTLQDRAGDSPNVLDFGAKLDGVAFDNAAYQAARTAARPQGVIIVPNGQQRLNVTPTGGPTGQVLWRMDGTYIGSAGANPVTGIGTDVVENFLAGSKYFGRTNSFAAVSPVLRVDSTINHAGGTAGVISAVRVNQTASVAIESAWGISTVVTDNRAVGNAMALAGYTVRTAARPNGLSYGLNTYVTDTTGLASSLAGSACGIEVDIIANGLDDGGLAGPFGVPAGAGIRTVLQAVGDAYDDGRPDCEIGWGVRVTPSSGKSNVVFKRQFAAMGRFNKAAFSTEFATPDSPAANAIWLGDEHTIALNKAGSSTLGYTATGTPRLRYMAGGTERWSIDNNGKMILAGDPTTPMGAATKQYVDGKIVGPVTATGSTTARTLQDRFADWENPKDYGAQLNGIANDSVAMNNVRASTAANGTIYVPSGGWNVITTPSAGPANGSVLWQLSGNCLGTGSNPVINIGTSQDFVESFFSGTKYFGKLHNPINAHAGVRLDYTLDTVGGSNGWVAPAFQVNTTINNGVVDSPWGIMSNMTVNANFNNFWPQPVAIGVNVYKRATAQSWGLGVYIDDFQGLSSKTGGGINGMEMGIKVNGLDDAVGATNTGYGSRRFFDLIVSTHGTGTTGEVGNGVLVRNAVNDPASVHHGFHTLGNVSYSFTCESTTGVVGLDTSLAILSGSAIRLAAEQKLSLTGAEDHYLQYTTTGTRRLRYMAGATEALAVSDAGAVTAAATIGSASRPGFLAFNAYYGDTTHPWFTGGNWGFGWRALNLTDAQIRPLLVQRDAQYTGTLTGANPGALQVTNNVAAGVTGLESALIATLNTSATDGLYVAGTFNVNKAAAGSSVIAMNFVAADNSARMSSVSGAHVVLESDLNASGPDDAFNRINMEVTFKETPGHPSPDGNTTFLYGGIRCRGMGVHSVQTGKMGVPAASTYAFGATTMSAINGGLMGSFVSPFLADGCSGAAYSAVSAVQTMPTSASFASGISTITLTNPLATAGYVWPGALVTGTNIAAGTHVLTYEYDGSAITTITIDKPTSGALTSGQSLTFTNAIGTGFKASGYLTTAAFNSPGFNVSPSGSVTMQSANFGTLPINAANDAAAASAGVPVRGVYRNGNILQVRIT